MLQLVSSTRPIGIPALSRVAAVTDRLVVPPADGLDLLESARDRMLGHDTEGADDADAQEELVRRARQRAEDLEDRPEDNAVQFTARVLGGNVRLLLGMIRVNRPWTLVVRLSRLLALAAATGVLTLVASDLWLLAAAYGPGRLGLLSIAAVTASLVVGARLWERPRRRGEREQVALFNLATAATVALGAGIEDDDAVRAAAYTRSGP